MYSTIGGQLGFILTNLMFVSSGMGALAYFLSYFDKNSNDQKSWNLLGNTGFFLQFFSVFATFFTLFYLIYTHQYQYHYVWAHSSNELPIHFMISCFWEGQEGSFLLWLMWHAVLGLWIYLRNDEWKPLVLSVLLSVQAILASMILGVVFNDTLVISLLIFFLIIIAYFVYQQNHVSKTHWITAFCLIFLQLALIFTGNTGLGFKGFQSLGFIPYILFLIGVTGYFVFEYYQTRLITQNFLSIYSLLVLSWILFFFELDEWKIGSSPFILLKDAMPNAPIFSQDPNFVPTNGNGLNPLLQNYWMVIHPPVLFLGFASSLIPFAYAVAGLIKNQLKEWITPAMPYAIFSSMVLGIGIIMGGYWAYETLNFGGYWNWDPVENASLVPWLTGVAAIHAMLIWKSHKKQLSSTLFLTLVTFVLVLYSTFLNRSGILGEASVHTFTDLGLSGQLLALIFLYLLGVIYLWLLRKSSIHVAHSDSQNFRWFSREGVLLIGIIIFSFAALEITFFTSTPVINKILGTNFAPPANVPFFYYKWNVWFGILIGIFSGLGQFYYWYNIEKVSLSKALQRPFWTALISSTLITLMLIYFDWEFVYQKTYAEILSLAEAQNIWNRGFTYLNIAILIVADDILLLASLFSLFCNVDVAIHLLRKHKSHWKNMGGSLAHIGFALMMIGILFSSGYEWIVSVNYTPAELANFPANSQNDNVLLSQKKPKYVNGYRIDYKGLKQPSLPLKDIFIIEKNASQIKVAFKDSLNDVYALAFPTEFFELTNKEFYKNVNNKELDWQKVLSFISQNIRILRPKLINNRQQYAMLFTSLKDSTDKKWLYPEAEINERMGLLAHPDRKIEWFKDVYVHVTSVPNDEQEPRVADNEYKMALGDTVELASGNFMIAKGLYKVEGEPKYANYEVVARAELLIISGEQQAIAKPAFLVDKKGNVKTEAFSVPHLGMQLGFIGVEPKAGKIHIRVIEQLPPDDRITIKALAKPFINILWLGTFVLALGFLLALLRRFKSV